MKPVTTAAALLLRRRAAGYLVAAIMLVNGTCMALALTAMVAASAVTAGRSALGAAPFAVLALMSSVLTVVFLRASRAATPDPGAVPGA